MTYTVMRAGSIDIKALGVYGGGIGSCTGDGRFSVRGYLIYSCEDDHFFGTVCEGGEAISGAVDIEDRAV